MEKGPYKIIGPNFSPIKCRVIDLGITMNEFETSFQLFLLHFLMTCTGNESIWLHKHRSHSEIFFFSSFLINNQNCIPLFLLGFFASLFLPHLKYTPSLSYWQRFPFLSITSI